MEEMSKMPKFKDRPPLTDLLKAAAVAVELSRRKKVGTDR